METIPESINQGSPSDGNPSHFPSFGNTGDPYMATLSLPGFTIGLLVWLLSTHMVPNVQTTQSTSPRLEQHQPHVVP